MRSVLAMAGVAVLLAMAFLQKGNAADDTAPTFTKDVAPILFTHCVKCHSAGEIAYKLPLASYETARPLAESIKRVVLARAMPPWPADPARSIKFRNDARLSQRDIDTLVAWVDAGAPKGNDADLPPLPPSEDGRALVKGRKPDLVLSLPGLVHLPAKGELPYVKVLVKVPFLSDRWVVASQTRPSNPAVVHHMAITELSLDEGVTPAQLDQLQALARQIGFTNSMVGAKPAVTDALHPQVFDMLGVYTPGTTLESYPEGTAKLLKGGKNVYLDFNMHYRTTGETQTDQSMIALWFEPEPPKHQLFRVPGAGQTIIANGKQLLTDTPGTKAEGMDVAIPPIPPHAQNYEVTGVTGYTESVTIYSLQPHAHDHARNFTYTVVYPDGREETVLSVPKFDHRWQMAYELATPLRLPAGSKLMVTAHYDNSQTDMPGMNMGKLEPDKPVYFRGMNSTKDEMFTPFITYSIDRLNPANPAAVMRLNAGGGSLEVGEVVGCLEASSQGSWLLTAAGNPQKSQTQSTNSVELRAAETSPAGNGKYTLLGAGIFSPDTYSQAKVAVKGVLIKGADNRINVTSLQKIATSCGK